MGRGTVDRDKTKFFEEFCGKESREKDWEVGRDVGSREDFPLHPSPSFPFLS